MKLLLRISAILMLLHTAGHTIGALTWRQAPNSRVAAVIKGMQTEHYPFMGRQISLASFFDGYGFTMIGVLLLITILLWLLSVQPNRGMILVVGLFLLFMGIIELIYFFPFAAAFSLLAGTLTLITLWRK